MSLADGMAWEKEHGVSRAPAIFPELPYEELLKRLAAAEAELEQLRPKPPKFKVGQILMSYAATPGLIKVASYRCDGIYHMYGFARMAHHVGQENLYVWIREDKVRALNQVEISGEEATDTPHA